MNYETLALSTLLFMVYFSCFSLLISTKNNPTSKTDYPPFTYKEAFSAAYDPEPIIDPELTNQVTTVANEVITTPTTTENSQQLCLLPHRLSRVTTVVNGVIITPPPATTSQVNQENTKEQTTTEDNVQPEKPALSITEQNRMLCLFSLPENPSIRQLRQIIKQHNLQTFVKNKLGKSVSKCRKDELIRVLS